MSWLHGTVWAGPINRLPILLLAITTKLHQNDAPYKTRPLFRYSACSIQRIDTLNSLDLDPCFSPAASIVTSIYGASHLSLLYNQSSKKATASRGTTSLFACLLISLLFSRTVSGLSYSVFHREYCVASFFFLNLIRTDVFSQYRLLTCIFLDLVSVCFVSWVFKPGGGAH